MLHIIEQNKRALVVSLLNKGMILKCDKRRLWKSTQYEEPLVIQLYRIPQQPTMLTWGLVINLNLKPKTFAILKCLF